MSHGTIVVELKFARTISDFVSKFLILYNFIKVLWSGRVLEPRYRMDESTRAIDDLNKLIANDTRVYASLLPVADGLTIAFKK